MCSSCAVRSELIHQSFLLIQGANWELDAHRYYDGHHQTKSFLECFHLNVRGNIFCKEKRQLCKRHDNSASTIK